MTSYVVTTYGTSLSFPTLMAVDNVTITAVGGIIAPAATLTGGGSNTIHIAGELELFAINLFGNDYLGISASGSFYSTSNISAISTGASGQSTIINEGSISCSSGIAIYALGLDDLVINSGRILSDSVGVRLGEIGTDHQRLENSGEIFGRLSGVRMMGAAELLNNSGLIHSASFSAITVYGEANNIATQQTVVNSGLVTTAGYVAIEVSLYEVGSTFLMQNTGSIVSSTIALQSYGVSMDRITNAGIMAGTVDLGAGDDLYDGRGGELVGSLFLGNGNDTADLRGSLLSGYVYGGNGSDVFFLSDAATVIVDTGIEIDLVFAECSYRLAANLENLTLLDGGNFAGFGNSAANLINGNSGDNRLSGLDGLDTIFGDLGDDRINGGNQNDDLSGDDGDDTLLGGTGNDLVNGGEGNDSLVGGLGRDSFFGGSGSDAFVFTALAQTANTATTADKVSDFTRGEDVIVLTAIDANTSNTASNDTFTFIGAAAFGAVAGQVRYLTVLGVTYVQMDVTGDGVSDAQIALTGTYVLNANDFAL